MSIFAADQIPWWELPAIVGIIGVLLAIRMRPRRPKGR